jgi:Ca-activated chloride channel family protein
MIRQGTLPPKDAVRIEEMINYFPYALAAPRPGEPFAVVTELVAAPWQPQHQLARISLHSQRADLRDMPPNNLVFLLDVSGSMTPANKLPLLKQAMRMLVAELRAQDRVAIVVYAGSAGLVLESTPGSEKERILDAIERLEAGGSTAGGAGIRLAYDVARKSHISNGSNRIILATDGDFNVGVSSDAEMVRLIEEKREQGTYLTVLGFGMGNLKDSRLEKIADHGNGNYAYIDDLAEARKVLVSEMGGTLLTVAKDVKVQVEFNPELVRAYRLIGYENRLLANEDFADDRKDAGEIGAGHTVTALYEIVPAGVEGTVDVREPGALRYQRAAEAIGTAPTDELAFVKLRYKEPDGTTSRLLQRPVRPDLTSGSDDIRFAAAVAGFGMLLRNSEHRGNTTYELVVALASDAVGADADGYRREFLQLVDDARALSTVAAAAGR